MQVSLEEVARTFVLEGKGSRVSYIGTLNLNGVVLSPEARQRLDGMHVERLELAGCGLDDADDLARVSGLTHLILSDNPIADDGLRGLASLGSLERLELARARIRGPGLARLPRSIRQLDLESNPMDALGDELTHLGELRELNLRATGLTDEGLRALSDLSSLRVLNLAETAITGQTLPSLLAVRTLRSLDLGGTGVTDEQVAPLAALERLSELRLDGTGVDVARIHGLLRQRRAAQLRERQRGRHARQLYPLLRIDHPPGAPAEASAFAVVGTCYRNDWRYTKFTPNRNTGLTTVTKHWKVGFHAFRSQLAETSPTSSFAVLVDGQLTALSVHERGRLVELRSEVDSTLHPCTSPERPGNLPAAGARVDLHGYRHAFGSIDEVRSLVTEELRDVLPATLESPSCAVLPYRGNPDDLVGCLVVDDDGILGLVARAEARSEGDVAVQIATE